MDESADPPVKWGAMDESANPPMNWGAMEGEETSSAPSALEEDPASASIAPDFNRGL